MNFDTFHAQPSKEWGKLVKSWATGVNQFSPDSPVPPRPDTLQELVEICTDFGIELKIPDRISEQNIDWHVARSDTLSIRLPPKELVDEFEQLLRTEDYFLPGCYLTAFGLANLQIADPSDRVDFQACRIGDYSIGMCV